MYCSHFTFTKKEIVDRRLMNSGVATGTDKANSPGALIKGAPKFESTTKNV